MIHYHDERNNIFQDFMEQIKGLVKFLVKKFKASNSNKSNTNKFKSCKN